MEKTIEYMRTAVLAECEAVCPSRLYAPIECGHLAFGYVEDDGVQMEAWFLYVGAATAPMSLYALAGEQVWLAAYYLLGLDKRDALEAHTRKEAEFEARMNLMDAKQEKYMDLYRTEKEKSKRWESRAWKILQIVRRPSHRSRPKTAAVLRTLREVSEKNERLVEELEEIKYEDEVNGKGWENNHNSTYSRLCRVLEAYKEGKKDGN